MIITRKNLPKLEAIGAIQYQVISYFGERYYGYPTMEGEPRFSVACGPHSSTELVIENCRAILCKEINAPSILDRYTRVYALERKELRKKIIVYGCAVGIPLVALLVGIWIKH